MVVSWVLYCNITQFLGLSNKIMLLLNKLIIFTIHLVLLTSTRNWTKINNKEMLHHKIITTNEITNFIWKNV